MTTEQHLKQQVTESLWNAMLEIAALREKMDDLEASNKALLERLGAASGKPIAVA